MTACCASSPPMIEIRQAGSAAEIAQAKTLLQEYAKALNFDLCFQSFDAELANLPGDYAPPAGRLLLAYVDGETAGSIALHAWSESNLQQAEGRAPHSERREGGAKGGNANICEMKRLYVRPQFRGHSLGRQLIDRILTEARAIGYTHMRLDTISGTMD